MSAGEVELEFMEVFVHTVLYARSVYPAELFQQRSKYGVSVFQSVHPQINTYVQRVLSNAQPLLEAGVATRLIVALKRSNAQQPFETISVDYERRPAGHAHAHGHEHELGRLEAELGAMLLKVTSDGLARPEAPEDTTFTLLVATRDCTNNEEHRAALERALDSNQWILDEQAAAIPAGQGQGLRGAAMDVVGAGGARGGAAAAAAAAAAAGGGVSARFVKSVRDVGFVGKLAVYVSTAQD